MKHQKKKIVVIGSYNVGLTFHTLGMPSWGETKLGHGFTEGYGGKGSNQAVAASRLGGDVTFIGKVGEDKYGDDGLKLLKENHVNTEYVKRTSKKMTGAGAILVNEENDNFIIVDPGANFELSPEEIEELEDVIEANDILILQLEIPIETAKKAMEIAYGMGKQVILNPAPAHREARNILSLANIINPNESELLLLNGKDPHLKIDEYETINLGRNLLIEGPEIVIVTRGSKDCLVITEDEVIKVPIYSVNAEDTTGAGDSFTGALGVALSENKTLREAIEFANLTGSYCVTKKEVIPGLPTREELESFRVQFQNDNIK